MGASDRRQRHREQIKADILSAAWVIAAAEGWQAVSMRRIAEAIEYTAPVIYEHFQNKDALLAELAAAGFLQLGEVLAQAIEGNHSPREKLLRASLAYWHFFVTRTDIYEVMFGFGAASRTSAVAQEAVDRAFTPVTDALRFIVSFSEDHRLYFREWWALLHGLAALKKAKTLPVETTGDGAIEYAIRRFIDGIGA